MLLELCKANIISNIQINKKEDMIMKKIVTLFMFTFFALTGYYVGVAVAQNNAENMNTNEPVGVIVVEEQYSIEATPNTEMKQDKKTADAKNNNEKATSDVNGNNTEEAEIVEEDVTEDDEE